MKTMILILAMISNQAMAATECKTFSDGVTVCYPTGGGSSYGR